ncbi:MULTISPECIES: bacteriophage spanin2 family protein [unclassified Phaeobacter]|uniref:bacteriophage spanin2 family protein n=1 Tax=unclassified Phaeobacter TaxID=2621772 RepID=UPI003A8C0A50
MRSLSLLMLCVVLASCAKGAGIIAGAIAGGPNVAANVQAGRTNAQTIGQTTLQDQRIDDTQARNIEQSSGDTQLRTERVETVILREDPPAWLLLVALIGWLLPTPQQIGAAFVSLVARPFRGSLPGG